MGDVVPVLVLSLNACYAAEIVDDFVCVISAVCEDDWLFRAVDHFCQVMKQCLKIIKIFRHEMSDSLQNLVLQFLLLGKMLISCKGFGGL